jgi:hypothetical protein
MGYLVINLCIGLVIGLVVVVVFLGIDAYTQWREKR